MFYIVGNFQVACNLCLFSKIKEIIKENIDLLGIYQRISNRLKSGCKYLFIDICLTSLTRAKPKDKMEFPTLFLHYA